MLSYYAEFLIDAEPDRATALTDQLCDILEKGDAVEHGLISGLAGTVFEFAGDREPDHLRALRRYRLGTQVAGGWAQLWVKGMGAGRQAGQADTVRAMQCAIATPETALDKLAKSKSAHLAQEQKGRRRGRAFEPHVVERWRAGYEAFRDAWGSDPRVAASLGPLGR